MEILSRRKKLALPVERSADEEARRDKGYCGETKAALMGKCF